MLDFVFWILDLVLDFGFGTLDFEFLGFGCWILGHKGWGLEPHESSKFVSLGF